jgi:chloramphenicol-sensitive protein RarD
MPHSTPTTNSRAGSGVTAVAVAFFIWGLLPLYLKPLIDVPALQISGWRSIMGCVVAVSWIAWRGELPAVWRVFTQPALLSRLALTSGLLATNWVLYAWGVAHGQVLLTSLGYFINPLVNVLLGVLVLSERLNRAQWTAVALATTAVLILTAQSGELPWLSLVLAVSFSLYGLLRKTATAAPLTGLAVESLLAAPVAFAYLLFIQPQHSDIHYTPLMIALLAGSGVMTIVPLALFNYGAQRISYATVGMLQYIGPTLQFLIGVFIYKEALSSARLLCFATIWLALVIYAGDSAWRSRGLRNLR